MNRWLAVLTVVLSVAAHSALAQSSGRGEFEPPVRMPVAPEPLTPGPIPMTPPSGLPPIEEADDKPADKPAEKPPVASPPVEPNHLPPTAEVVPPGTAVMTPPPAAITASPAGPACGGCGGCQADCQAKCKRSCGEKLAAWLCHHRENCPDICCQQNTRDAQLYTYFLDHPCRDCSITVPGPAFSCSCKKPCPFDGSILGHVFSHGNACCGNPSCGNPACGNPGCP